MIGRHLGECLPQPEMLPNESCEQFQSRRRMALASVTFVNVNGDSGALLTGLEFIQIHRANRCPISFGRFAVEHPSALSISVQVRVADNELHQCFLADGLGVGTHPPIRAVVFPIMKNWNVHFFHGPQPMHVVG